MNQQIRYRGLSLAKDEHAVNNGELSLCANCELHDGALRPSVLTGTTVATNLSDGSGNACNLLYVHNTTSYTHLIAYCPTTKYIVWFQKDGTLGGSLSHDFSSGIKDIDSIGNTLIVIAADGIHYILYKNTNNNYKYLGQKPPFLSIRFSLSDNYSADYQSGGIEIESSAAGFNCAFQQTTLSCGDTFEPVIKNTAYTKGEPQLRVKPAKQSDVTENAWALVNRTNNKIAEDGHFYANFFVRYCYRLYDGSMVMHSAPVFMPVLVPNNFLVYVANVYNKDDHTVEWNDELTLTRGDAEGKKSSFKISKLTFMYYPRNVSLQYSLQGDNTVSSLKEWSDIVTSVDFFITPPLTRTDDSQTVKSFVLAPDNIGIKTIDKGGIYSIWSDIWTFIDPSLNIYEINTVIDFPGIEGKAYADKIANQSAFFKVCTFNIDDIQPTGSEPQDLPIDQSVLLTISAQEQMKDDYKSHNMLYPKGCYVYNHRLNLYGLYETLFTGFSPAQLFTEGVFPTPASSSTETVSSTIIKKIVVRLNTDNGYKYVEVESAISVTLFQLYNCPMFYPDARADRMYINFQVSARKISDASSTTTEYWAQFTLTPCNELNGSMHVGNMKVVEDNIANYSTIDAPSYTLDNVVTMYNRIYTSEQNNPFYFPVEAINTVGTGDIIGLAATTRALSQGQFGQFPLMAFTTDGIWALNVASTGTYSSIHPISREVCVNDSICQLDQSVVFATDRALNKVVESSVASFSDILDGPFFSIASSLKKIADYFGTDGKEPDTAILALINFNTPPIEYFKAGIVLNDFVNNRIIVLPKDSQDDKVVALVYSVRDDAWSTMLIDHPKAVINSYPYPYLQLKSGRVISLDKKYDYTDVSVHNALIVTRTLSFDNTMLAITGLDQQTDAKNKQTVLIFGSNDNRQWHYVGSTSRNVANYLPGHSYRWFRLAIALQLTQGEKYFQTNLNVTQKYEKI